MEKKTIALSLIFNLGIVFLCSIMLVSFFYTIQIPDRQAERGQWVGHAREVISQLNLLEENIYKAAFAKNIKSVSLFSSAREQVYANLNALQKLTADNPSQQKKIMQLEVLVTKAFLNPEIIVGQFKLMREEEETLLVARIHAWQLALQHTKITLGSIQLLLFTAILITYLLLFRELVKRRRAITDRVIEEDRLHAIVSLQNSVMTSDLNVNKMMN